tara:strand:+ start:139 stop:348 length:210 start_codon:yes stop_codon:yes gene_type:complete
MSERGPNDLEETINKQKKVIEMLQYKCRKAGRAIIELNVKNEGLEKEIDRLSEENTNIRTMFGADKNDS